MRFEITAEPCEFTINATAMLFRVTGVDAMAPVIPPVIPTPAGVLVNEDGTPLINDDGSSLITD